MDVIITFTVQIADFFWSLAIGKVIRILLSRKPQNKQIELHFRKKREKNFELDSGKIGHMGIVAGLSKKIPYAVVLGEIPVNRVRNRPAQLLYFRN